MNTEFKIAATLACLIFINYLVGISTIETFGINNRPVLFAGV